MRGVAAASGAAGSTSPRQAHQALPGGPGCSSYGLCPFPSPLSVATWTVLGSGWSGEEEPLLGPGPAPGTALRGWWWWRRGLDASQVLPVDCPSCGRRLSRLRAARRAQGRARAGVAGLPPSKSISQLWGRDPSQHLRRPAPEAGLGGLAWGKASGLTLAAWRRRGRAGKLEGQPKPSPVLTPASSGAARAGRK